MSAGLRKWAHSPFFCLCDMQQQVNALTKLVQSVVEPMGYELIGVEYLTGYQGGNLLRVYIDSEDGIQLDDCTKVSHQLSGVLDVEDPIRGEYNLEVSSPGMDRPLFTKEHYERFTGHKVHIKLLQSLTGRRKYKGILIGIDGDCVVVEVDGQQYELPLDQIQDARLVPEF